MSWQKQDLSKAKKLPVKTNNKFVELDPVGYFLIRLVNNAIEIGFCNNQHQMLYFWASANAVDLSKAINEQSLGLTEAHALYLGRELARAQAALEAKAAYLQD